MPEPHPLYQRMTSLGISLQDVASKAGCHKTTVHKQLIGIYQLRDDIQALIEEMIFERVADEMLQATGLQRAYRVWEAGEDLMPLGVPSGSTDVGSLTSASRQKVGTQLDYYIRFAYITQALMAARAVETIDDLISDLDEERQRMLQLDDRSESGEQPSAHGAAVDGSGDEPAPETQPDRPEESGGDEFDDVDLVPPRPLARPDTPDVDDLSDLDLT